MHKRAILRTSRSRSENVKKLLIIVPLLLIVAAGGLYFYANRETENQLDRYIERAIASGAYNDIQYESAEFGMDGTINISNLSITDATDFNYTIDNVEIANMDFLNTFPRTISVTASGFGLPQGAPELDGVFAPELEELLGNISSTQVLPIEMRYNHEYQPTDNDLFTSTMNIGLPDSFNFSFSSTTRNIPYEMLNQISDQAEAQAAFSNALFSAEIPEVSLSISDFGLLDAYIQGQADEQGRNAQVIRDELMQMTQSLFLFAPTDLQNMAIDLGNELSTFLEGNRTFNLAVRPDFSGSVQQLQTPIMTAFFNNDYAQIVDLLNVEFFTE
ncbi:MAG: hypothetical protein CMP91_11150 [Gammaproteobacteria bacterium]|nr:hypothetical protein [Gammaproteobacteria bacterium]MAY03348.1 hypothetical protein [Gammaproteobacteria bacterium]|tara:strand:+ start:1173 stop:2162 length:990 start_codon:yes stop_codon:yes gene_type:complete